jgi:hypothetical protein
MKWTNPTLRAHLTQHGFVEDDRIVNLDLGMTYTTFVRGEDELTLVEFAENREPEVYQNGEPVDVSNIGFRNEQIQHQPLKGD